MMVHLQCHGSSWPLPPSVLRGGVGWVREEAAGLLSVCRRGDLSSGGLTSTWFPEDLGVEVKEVDATPALSILWCLLHHCESKMPAII